MLSINTSFDDADAQALLKHWMLEMGKTMHDAVVRAGVVAARSFGEKTWPKDLKQFQGSIERQVNRVYASKSSAYEAIKDASDEKTAKAFWFGLGRGGKAGIGRARAILAKHGGKMAGVPLQKFDGGEAHMAIKRNNKRGRIERSVKPRMVVMNDGQNAKGNTPLGKYIAKKQALIGLTQSAWYNCMRLLDARNRRSKSKDPLGADTEQTKPFPKWVSNHKTKGYGAVYFNEEAERFGVVLHNNIRWSQHALEAGAERYIMRRSREHLIKSLIIDIIKQRNKVEREARRA